VNEVYRGGDFLTLKAQAQGQGVNMTEAWWRRLLLQCLRALEFMHEQAMVHCDIKEPNLMLKTADYRRPEVVIIDFGVAQSCASSKASMSGTPNYMPPEVWTDKKWYPVGDIFSMGVVMVQMVTDNIPEHHRALRPGEMLRGIFAEGCDTVADVARATQTREAPVHLVAAQFPGLADLTRGLLEKDWCRRPTADQALAHAWLAKCSSSLGHAGARAVAAAMVAKSPLQPS